MKPPSLSSIVARIDTDDDDDAIAAMSELVDRVPLASPAPTALLLEATHHARARVRQAGARGLGCARGVEDRAECRERLLALTRDEASMVVASAAEALGAFADDAPSRDAIAARLLALLVDPESGVLTRENAIASLGRVHTGEGVVVPADVREAVRRATRDRSPEVASMARWASTRFDAAGATSGEEEAAPASLEEAEARLRAIDAERRRTSRLFYGSMGALVVAVAVAPMNRVLSGAVALLAVALLLSWSTGRRRTSPEARIRAQLAVTRARLAEKDSADAPR